MQTQNQKKNGYNITKHAHTISKNTKTFSDCAYNISNGRYSISQNAFMLFEMVCAYFVMLYPFFFWFCVCTDMPPYSGDVLRIIQSAVGKQVNAQLLQRPKYKGTRFLHVLHVKTATGL